MEIRIRRYKESDRAAFIRLMEELQDHLVSIDEMKRIRRMPEYGESYTRRTLRKVAENNGIIYVAEHEGRPIGLAVGIILEPTGEDLLEGVPSKDGIVLELAVEARYRRRGVGTMLMRKLEEYFKENRCDVSRVAVFAPNRSTHELYRELGYHDRDIYLTKKL
jgi:ribosomal protein S18 acetylase RimI-like enzyme